MTEPRPLVPAGRRFDGRGLTVWYDARRCTDVGECVRLAAEVFDLAAQPAPVVHPDAEAPDRIAEVVRACPTGALHYRLADGSEEAATAPTTITVRPEGPIWIRGDLLLETADGPVAERRAALCGCGRTANRPFCDMACTREPAP